ncbi:ATP-dependent helicase HrpB [Marinomonas dokdonensis]|uniref:ATP-dependent helicase HrpB n=1 Tax=Marinomonas dokdonensis TaxID=328224 RepID=UPI0040556496
MLTDLPIQALIPALQQQLRDQHQAILEAAPGAGKTTVVPLELMNEEWRQGRKIIMLEPRRLAAKTAAQRLADSLNEPLGQRIGYRIRHEGKESKQTQVLVVTEGVLTRMLHSDPSLQDVALIIFDEFHERNLHSDLAFALCLQARELYRDEDPLKLLVMSATLDTELLEARLGCPTLSSTGRSFPIEVIYANKALKIAEVTDEVARLTCQAFAEQEGSLLVFLPGQKEIRSVERQLRERLGHHPQLQILPLYGELSLKEQQAVIQPSPASQRKIVLATAIAQTSLTIEGIRVVIDSGLSREARFDANTATTRLHTRRATQAETTQRMGRAGRTQTGVCYRWWSENQQHQLAPQAQPQIEITDLSNLVLDVACWGVQERLELDWITPPPLAHWQQAIDFLGKIDALDAASNLELTSVGESMSKLAIEPRLARLLIEAVKQNDSVTGSAICAILSEGDPFKQHHTDLADRLAWLAGNTNQQSKKPRAVYQQAQRQWQQRCQSLNSIQIEKSPSLSPIIECLLISAFADRIAQRVQQDNQKVRYKLANGRMASIDIQDPCVQNEWLIALDMGGHNGQQEDRIYLACGIHLSSIETSFKYLIDTRQQLTWSNKHGRLICEEQQWVGKLCITTKALQAPNAEAVCQAVCSHIRQQGLNVLPWDEQSRQLQARVAFARSFDKKNEWPDFSDQALLANLEDWLGPYLGQVTNQQAMDKLPLANLLLNQLSWPEQQALSAQVPSKITAASGNQHSLDYTVSPPTLRVKLQEMFGVTSSPTVLQQAIRIELLSPGQRPLAVTQDLAFFWQQAYPEVRKEMRGRYPKHPWPEDPLTALATAKTNRALRST